MKNKKLKKEIKKFDLEKFEVAKLKNMHLIVGGGQETDPVDTNGTGGASSRACLNKKQDFYNQ